MSWDVKLIRTNAEQIEEICDKTTMPFQIDKVLVELEKHLDGVETADPTWLSYETDGYAVSFQLASEAIVLHLHLLDENSESLVAGLIDDLCEWLDCRAIDMTNYEFI